MRTQPSATPSNKVTVKLMAIIALLIAALLMPSASLALNNVQLQMAGGLAAVHGRETYFFAPTDQENEWGVYAVSSCTSGPLVKIKDVQPSRILYADGSKVYFLAVRIDGGYILASIDLKSGKPTMLLDKVKEVYAETEETVFYTPLDDALTLYRYSFPKNSSSKLKTMTSKNIYDSMLAAKDKIYFLGQDLKDNSVVAYEINKPGAKAVNMNPPSPNIGDGILYNGYLVYTPKGDTTKVYTVLMGKTKGTRLGETVLGMSLKNDRFGDALYPYDTPTNSIVRVPLDGSATSSLPLTTMGQTTVLMGGTDETIYYWDDGQVFSVDLQLSSKKPLFPFKVADDAIYWTNISPTASGSVLMYGYTILTYLENAGTTLPTAVRLMDPSTGQMVFQAPAIVPTVVEGPPVPNAANPSQGSDSTGETIETQAPISEDEDISFTDIIGG
ncbi:hypothetical protein AGMMS49992_23250 [Clostridia bacterium]|nr:hypothetical protein AGMMS49992_23250 [Clostridia bacterium]